MENFDLKKYLTENKRTVNSRMLSELQNEVSEQMGQSKKGDEVKYDGEKHLIINILNDGSPVLVPMSVIDDEAFAVDSDEVDSSKLHSKVKYDGEKHLIVNILKDGSSVLVPMSVLDDEAFAVDSDEIEVDDMPGFEGTRDSLDSLSIREEVPTAEGKRTANSKLINEGSFFDRYDSEASVKVGRALTDIVDIFNKTAEEEDREVEEMIKAAEEETGTEVTRLERIYLNKHKQWIRTLALRMER